jgi:hypothetical protein
MCAILVQSSKENNMPLDYPQASIVATSKEQNKQLKSSNCQDMQSLIESQCMV